MRIKRHLTRFQKELKRQIRLAIAAAIGVLIAYAWKDYIFKISNSMYSNLAIAMPHMSSFLSALTLTLIGVILIFISSKLLD